MPLPIPQLLSMLRLLRISKRFPIADDVPVSTPPFVVSIARRYQSRGLPLAQLVAAGEEGWRRAEATYQADAEQLGRWGCWWVKEYMLLALQTPVIEGPARE